MAGAVLDRELTRSRVQFSVATPADDSDIRALLRQTPMHGAISISLEREPNFFADSHLPEERKETIVARESGKTVCVGGCVVRELFVNGEACRVGYLSGLRLAASHAGRSDILRRGYEFFSILQQANPADFYFTSIASDNFRARSFLERSARGLPKYEFLSDYATVIIPSKSRKFPEATGKGAMRSDSSFQFTPIWSPEKLAGLERLGLRTSDILSIEGETVVLWDQRCFKQIVVRGYSAWLRLARPLVNALGFPRLPRTGETLSTAYACGLTATGARCIELISALRGFAAARAIQLISLGFARRDPRLMIVLRTFRCRVYWSRIYVVRWPGIGASASELDDRVVAPEIAFL